MTNRYERDDVGNSRLWAGNGTTEFDVGKEVIDPPARAGIFI